MLTQAQKVAIRRHLGVPFANTAQAGRLYGWRFTWYNEDLEYRMNNLQPTEEQILTGASLGSYRIDGRPTIGDQLVYTIASLPPVIYAVQQKDFALPPNSVNPPESSPLYSIALNSALALNAVLLPNNYSAVGVMPADLFSPQFMPPYFAEVLISAGTTTGLGFNLVAAQSGTTNLYVEAQGTPSPVVATVGATPNQPQTTLYGLIQICDYFAMGMTQAELSLWLTETGKTKFRQDEIRARRARYREYCQQLMRVMGGEEYVQKFGGQSGGGGVTA